MYACMHVCMYVGIHLLIHVLYLYKMDLPLGVLLRIPPVEVVLQVLLADLVRRVPAILEEVT